MKNNNELTKEIETSCEDESLMESRRKLLKNVLQEGVSLEKLKLLLKNDPNIVRDLDQDEEFSVLAVAMQNNMQQSAIKFLIDNGAGLYTLSNEEWLPINCLYDLDSGYIKILIEQGYDWHHLNKDNLNAADSKLEELDNMHDHLTHIFDLNGDLDKSKIYTAMYFYRYLTGIQTFVANGCNFNEDHPNLKKLELNLKDLTKILTSFKNIYKSLQLIAKPFDLNSLLCTSKSMLDKSNDLTNNIFSSLPSIIQNQIFDYLVGNNFGYEIVELKKNLKKHEITKKEIDKIYLVKTYDWHNSLIAKSTLKQPLVSAPIDKIESEITSDLAKILGTTKDILNEYSDLACGSNLHRLKLCSLAHQDSSWVDKIKNKRAGEKSPEK